MLELRDQQRLFRHRKFEYLEGHASVEVPVPCGVDHPDATAPNFRFELVAGAAQIRQPGHLAQVIDHRVAQLHRRRTSWRNSLSVEVTSRSLWATKVRSIRRAHAKWLVTEV